MAGSLEEVQDWMHLAERALSATRTLLGNGFHREAMSRAYYAMFYAAKAAVVSEGIRASKHSAVVSSFGHLFIHTGRVPSHLHQALTRAFADRQSADYTPRWETTKEEVETRLAQAEEFVSEVTRILDTTR